MTKRYEMRLNLDKAEDVLINEYIEASGKSLRAIFVELLQSKKKLKSDEQEVLSYDKIYDIVTRAIEDMVCRMVQPKELIEETEKIQDSKNKVSTEREKTAEEVISLDEEVYNFLDEL